MKFLEAEERGLHTLCYTLILTSASHKSPPVHFKLCAPPLSFVFTLEGPPLAKCDDFVYRCAGVQGGQERGGGGRIETGNRVVSVLRGEPSGAIDFPLDIQ